MCRSIRGLTNCFAAHLFDPNVVHCQLSASEIDTIGRRCGRPGDYPIPKYNNGRYPYGLGGTKVNPEHRTQAFSSGVYVTVRVAPFQADCIWSGEPGLVEAHPVGSAWFSIDWTTIAEITVAKAVPFDASVVLGDHTGKVLVVEKSADISLGIQARRAQTAGAVGVIVVNNVCESTFPAADLAPQELPGADGLLVTIPVIAIERDAGLRLADAAVADPAVNVTITTGYRSCPVYDARPMDDCPVDDYRWPPLGDANGVLYRQQLNRIVGFWDRWFEQNYFEMDMIGYADNRNTGSECKASFTANTYRVQTPGDNACLWAGAECQRDERHPKRASTNPCIFAHGNWQALHFRREDVIKYSRSECTRCTESSEGVQKGCRRADQRLWCGGISGDRFEAAKVPYNYGFRGELAWPARCQSDTATRTARYLRVTSSDFRNITAALGVPLCDYFPQGETEMDRSMCTIGECDRWNTTAELRDECSATRNCWAYTTVQNDGIGSEWVPECMKSCIFNGGPGESWGKFPSHNHMTWRRRDLLCGTRILAFREIEAYDDLGNRIRATSAEVSHGESDLLPADETIPAHHAATPAENCIDGDLDPYLVGHAPYGMKYRQGLREDTPLDVIDGHINGSSCQSERYDLDPSIVIDFGQAVTVSKLIIRLGHWQRGTIAGEKFALTTDREGANVVWSGAITSDWYYRPGGYHHLVPEIYEFNIAKPLQDLWTAPGVTAENMQATPVDNDPGGKFPYGGIEGRCPSPWPHTNDTECEKRFWGNLTWTNIDWVPLRCVTASLVFDDVYCYRQCVILSKKIAECYSHSVLPHLSTFDPLLCVAPPRNGFH